PDGRLWLHFNPTDARARAWLATADIPALARELILSKDNYQQLHTTENCVYGVFSDLVREIGDATEETGFLRFAMTERLLISGRHQALCAVDATRRVPEGGHRVETVAALLEKDTDDLNPALRLQAGKLAQRLDGLDHDIVELRERSRLLEEELHFKMEEESNRHLHTLSIVTTMLLPPTLVTGIFGMNTKDLPFTD